jgi:hypothetical protein
VLLIVAKSGRSRFFRQRIIRVGIRVVNRASVDARGLTP